MRNEPVYCDPAAINEAARAEWDRDSGLRAEFGNEFSTYAAYRRVVAAGRSLPSRRALFVAQGETK